MTAHSPAAQTLTDLFGATVARFPDRPAVSDDRRRMTYSELDAASSALAGQLAARGVRRGDRVGIYLNRGVDVFTAMLAVLKAGAAYAPIDPRNPDARRDLMISMSGSTLVVTAPGWGEWLRDTGAATLELRDEPAATDGPAERPTPIGADLACVLFTSGSSGTPKAIMLEHRNLVHLAGNAGLVPLEPTDRFGQVSSLSFDAFHIETWCSFAHGAEVVVLAAMAELVSRDLKRELKRHRITAMLVPTMAVNHVVHEDRAAFAALRVMYTGGDVLQPAAARALLGGTFNGQFHNLYGPSEITTACTGQHVEAVAEDCGSIPIGTALDRVTVRVLSEALDEVPDGALGELCIGGSGVARGYLDRPGLTADKFRPDPTGEAGARIYTSGDLGRRGTDGELLFCGRTDDQVKVRGFRVEPAEAERAIVRHPGVREAAVFVVGQDHDRSLVAIVVPHDRIPPKELRAFLSTSLPDYLVPSLFITAPKIPGNEHGKRDNEQLRRIADQHLARVAVRTEPTDDVERYLAGMWEQLLSVEWIAPSDDFFMLGGNSMLAFRAQLRIKRDLGVRLEVAEVFERSELGQIADLVRQRRTGLVPIPSDARVGAASS